ncbi:MAG: CAP domain-containing protein [Pseudomonadota bacterium]
MDTDSNSQNRLPVAAAAAQRRPVPPAAAVLRACLCSLLLTACGGASGPEAVSGSQTLNNGSGSGTPPLPPASPAPSSNSYNLGSTPQAVIDQCMTDADKAMLTVVNDTRASARSCGTVDYPASPALSWHCTLEDVALAHSRDMGDVNFFSHTGSDGLLAADRLTNAGYDWSAVGENIAAGQPDLAAVMSAWLNSPGHCANVMQTAFTEFGAASYTVSGSDYPIYWTQVFATPH